MSSTKIHITDNDNIDDENIKLETMEKGGFRNNIFSESDDDLINYDDSKIITETDSEREELKNLLEFD